MSLSNVGPGDPDPVEPDPVDADTVDMEGECGAELGKIVGEAGSSSVLSSNNDEDWVALLEEYELTEFQLRVLKSLRLVPSGKVTTYAALARYVGCGSAQAVGQALSHNPLVPRCPCHRVVRSDLGIGGYALGIEAKRRLLESEGVRLLRRETAVSSKKAAIGSRLSKKQPPSSMSFAVAAMGMVIHNLRDV